MGVYRLKNTGGHPSTWKGEVYADIGWEEFSKQMLELNRIVDAGIMSEEQKQTVKEAISSILMDGLMPAFSELQQIRASAGLTIPTMNRQQLYEDLARKLWKSYKELMQSSAKAMGFDIGFLFHNETKFREGLIELRKQNPRLRPGVESFLEKTRTAWQNDLSKFRNNIVEHQKSDRRQFADFYKPENAEGLFDAVWRTIVEILAFLLEVRLMDGTRLVEQHPDDPGPRWEQRFRYDHPAFKNMK